jgi:predicted GTPase
MGYGDEQTRELAETINNSNADLVLIATPIDLSGLIEIKKPALRVHYELQEIGEPTLRDVLERFVT